MRNPHFEEIAAKHLRLDIETIRRCYHVEAKHYAHWDNDSVYTFWAGWMSALGFDVPVDPGNAVYGNDGDTT